MFVCLEWRRRKVPNTPAKLLGHSSGHAAPTDLSELLLLLNAGTLCSRQIQEMNGIKQC